MDFIATAVKLPYLTVLNLGRVDALAPEVLLVLCGAVRNAAELSPTKGKNPFGAAGSAQALSAVRVFAGSDAATVAALVDASAGTSVSFDLAGVELAGEERRCASLTLQDAFHRDPALVCQSLDVVDHVIRNFHVARVTLDPAVLPRRRPPRGF